MAQFVIAVYPIAGHINPAIQFAHRLIRAGARVTIFTTVYAHRLIVKSSALDGLSYASFSDGYDEGVKPTDDLSKALAQRRQQGKEALADLMRTLADERRPVTCVIYTHVLSWAAEVARANATPSVLLWLQSATVFGLSYFTFHGHGDLIANCFDKGPSSSIKLPGLPMLTSQELPSFVVPSYPNSLRNPAYTASIRSAFQKQFEILDKEEKPRVFINTFDEAEHEAIQAVDKVSLMGVGPLVPEALLDRQNRSDSIACFEMHKASRNYIDWMDTKRDSSVVYVSFGSLYVPNIKQMVEILNGLLESGHPFFWVIRPTGEGAKSDDEMEFWKRASAAEEIGEGMVVPWCSQVEVLSHPSIGCFVSHCGWNSTLESLVAGVPMICLRQLMDQTTNAKMVEDIWKMGVRAQANEEGIFEGEELKRCLELVMEREEDGEFRKNAKRWKDSANEAIREGGSLDRSIQAFVEEMRLCNVLEIVHK